MKEEKLNVENETSQAESLDNSSRRGFLGHLTKGAIAAAAVGAVGAKPFLDGKASEVAAQKVKLLPSTLARATAVRDYRINTAIENFNETYIGPRPNNGDEA
ncbi:MAG: twin-arginine translocation signal domain-containing protein, partial [Acidobacteriota bacterium]|nr:twin-arginine translocation signal domain-containing protein [Acidobacteriota bacterium]